MTQEELIKAVNNDYARNGTAAGTIKQFFSEHVCIKKGANRHPYADVLHEWVEGCEIEFTRSKYGFAQEYVLSGIVDPAKMAIPYHYRIKPQEPVYEWQWLKIHNNKALCATSDFLTDGQVSKMDTMYQMIKIEETKRERKQ